MLRRSILCSLFALASMVCLQALAADEDPLPLGCGIPTAHDADRPHLQESGTQCHGKSGDAGSCTPDARTNVSCTQDPRNPTQGTCRASVKCGDQTIRCSAGAARAWAGVALIDGVFQHFMKCEYDDGRTPPYATANCP